MKPATAKDGSSRIPSAVWLLAATAFLAPYIGGNLNLEASTLAPGIVSFLASIFDGVDTPGFADLFVALGALTCVIVLAARRRVLQLPNIAVGSALLVLIALITASVVLSSFKSVSVGAWTHWLAYALVFFAAASSTGRVRGPAIVLGAFVAGCSLSALLAIHEWGLSRAVDPTWRVFATWNNPNALAGVLVLGLVTALALLVLSERLAALGAGVATVAIAFALFLTQSRGGVLAAVVGVAAVLIVCVSAHGIDRRRTVVRLSVALGAALLLVALAASGNRTANAGLGQRLTAGGHATEQSTAFRLNLWRGALKSVAIHPVGTGIGTYGDYSAESGLTTETQLAHNTALQLAVEASVLAPVALVALVVVWLVAVTRGRRPEPAAAVLRGVIVAAVLAASVDGKFESNLFFFGTGVAVFLLMGLGLQLAADAVAPEYSPPAMRRSLLTGAAVVLALLAYYGYRETVKGEVRYARLSGESPDYGTLRTIADGDGEAHYLLASDPGISDQARLAEFKAAADLEPNVKHLSHLAAAYARSGDGGAAENAFHDALSLDPNNLDLLATYMDFERTTGHPESAVAIAKRMVEVESKPYFTVRAIPEVVPLRTAEARALLAGQTSNRREAAELLDGAAALYGRYADETVPYLRRNWHDLPTTFPMAGQTQTDVIEHLQTGIQTAKSAATAWRGLGDAVKAAAETGLASHIQSVLDAFTGALAGNK